MSNPWQQVFESHREQIEESYVAEKYGQHKSDESQETQALYDLRNKMKNMGKDAVLAYLKRSKMSPERKARLAKALGISIAEEVRNPYAIGMAAAMKQTGDTPPLKKSTITKAHKIAKKVEEDVEYIQEESKILVRVTKEDGSVFQKKIPASQLDDYRKRYKTVVVVGGSEQGGGGQVNSKNEEYVKEANGEKPKRWWDDDGDGIGYEKGEVSGKFKKKKKTRKEEYSDWRSEFPELAEATKAQKSVEGKAHSSYESEEGEKKKRKEKSSESECGCSHEVAESAEVLAQELGGELVDIQEFVRTVLKAPQALSAIKAFVRPKPIKIPHKVVPFTKPVKPGPIVPAKPVPKPAPTKPAPKPAPTKPGEIVPAKPAPKPVPTKPAPKPAPTKPGEIVPAKPAPKPVKTEPKVQPVKAPVKTAVGVAVAGALANAVKVDPKVGQTVSPEVISSPEGPGPREPREPRRPRPPIGGGTIPLPKPKLKPYLKDPVANPGILKL